MIENGAAGDAAADDHDPRVTFHRSLVPVLNDALAGERSREYTSLVGRRLLHMGHRLSWPISWPKCLAQTEGGCLKTLARPKMLAAPLTAEVRPKQVGLLLLPNFSLLGVIAAIDVMRHANRLSGAELYVSRIYSPDGKAVRASNGLVLNVDGAPGT